MSGLVYAMVFLLNTAPVIVLTCSRRRPKLAA